MNLISTTGNARCDALVDALKAEFGAVLTERILEAEAVDFLWDARIDERYLGQHLGENLDGDGAQEELSRVAILSSLDGRWHAGLCLVDGEGAAVELLWRRQFRTCGEAESEFYRSR